MKLLEYHEKRARGSCDFPVEFHSINNQHLRYRMPFHWHQEYEIIYVTNGIFRYEIGAESGCAYPGDILFIHSGIFHAGVPQGDNDEYTCIVFDFDQLSGKGNPVNNQMLESIMNGDVRVSTCLPKENSEFTSIVEQLSDLMANRRPGFELNVQGLLYQLFGEIIYNCCYERNVPAVDSQARLNRLKNAISLIEQNYSSAITLEQLAAVAEMSPQYFCHFFKQITQFSPIEYLNRHRIEVACYHLKSGWQNMTELTYECGFNDLSYFIRVFKKITGITPKKYAAMYRQAT